MQLETLDYRRAGELAYCALRDTILAGDLEPGARLNQDELARRLGVSRAPIRDALNRLEAEGLVQTLSRAGGVVVAETSEQEMVDIYELRTIIDSAAARLACERMSEVDLERLREIVDETERVTPEGNVHAIVQAHANFHFLIYAACGNAELKRVARNLWVRSYRYRLMALIDAGNARRGLAQHKDILGALEARDASRAAALAEAHNRSSINHLRPRLAEMTRSKTPDLGRSGSGSR